MSVYQDKHNALSTLEKTALEKLQPFSEFFVRADYIAVGWTALCRESLANKTEQQQEMLAPALSGGIKNRISVCFDKRIIEFPFLILQQKITHLVCSFWFSDEKEQEFKALGISLHYLISFEQDFGRLLPETDSVLQIRGMGKKSKNLELTLHPTSSLELIDVTTGRVRFSDQEMQESDIIPSGSFTDNISYQRMLGQASLIICRAAPEIQGTVFAHALSLNKVPMIPNAPTYLKSSNAIINALLFSKHKTLRMSNNKDNQVALFLAQRRLWIEQLHFDLGDRCMAIKDVLQIAMQVPSVFNREYSVKKPDAKFIVISFITQILTQSQTSESFCSTYSEVQRLRIASRNIDAELKQHLLDVLRHFNLAWLLRGICE